MLPRVERSSHSGMAGSKIVAVGLFPHMEFDSSGDFSKHYPFFKKMFLLQQSYIIIIQFYLHGMRST
jgi:hypothetical protein